MAFLDTVLSLKANRVAPSTTRQPATAPRAPQAQLTEGQLVIYKNPGNHTRFLSTFSTLLGLVLGQDERQRYVVQFEGGHVFHMYANAVTGEWQLHTVATEAEKERANAIKAEEDAKLEAETMDLSTAFSAIAANSPRGVITNARRVRDAMHLLIPPVAAGSQAAVTAAEPEPELAEGVAF